MRFALLVELAVEALLHHQGSGRQSFHQARQAKRLGCTSVAVYGKLRRVPLELSAALVRETTRRLSSEILFRSVCDQLAAYAVMLPAEPLAATLPKFLTPDDVRDRLNELLARAWSSLWIKAPPKRKRPPPITRPLPGGHASAWKLIHDAKNNSR